ncbi:hypothetical protein FC96_GL001905 [Secundilactobacillus kimchicus JCM 15530]|uniref:Gam-like protein n=1 Tax=Secundilactobacillus kimchicus JCM 15530 TaxID=1302272 RepID=A0A0R1HRF5_9LACO|nr:host-nuclease inhibitor Gam family protein [Secundilactobacillus kimchicus]KRK48169.1 hypothetical protein FC96_GL001905 [Secundilactobacillus kimchicus JCM 15530]
MSEVLENHPKAEGERFHINDDTAANWAFRKLAEINRELKDKQEQKHEFDRQTQEWFDRTTHDLNESHDYFESLLEEYRQTRPDGKINVPAGKAMVTKRKNWEHDDEQLQSFVATSHPEFIESKLTLKWGDFKKTLTPVKGGKAIDQDGQIVPGIHVTEREDVKFTPTKGVDDL